MNCLCLNKVEGEQHIEDCPYYIANKERLRAVSLLNASFNKSVKPERFNGKSWVDLDVVLDCLNEFKRTIMQNDEIKVDKV